MSKSDQNRWDGKWRDMAGVSIGPHPLLTEHARYLTGGVALDLACGRGQNAIWLASRGYEVLGVDISQVALDEAVSESRRLGLDQNCRFERVDLDRWVLPEDAFDLICVIRFLKRELFPAIRGALKEGGLLFYSTRHMGVLTGRPESNPNYLLRKGELAGAFRELTILHSVELTNDAELIAQKNPGAAVPKNL